MTRPGLAALAVTPLLAAGAFGAWMWTARPRTRAEAPGATSEAQQFWRAYNRASRHRTAGDADAAILWYAAALQLRPTHEDSLYYIGNCHLLRGDYAMAIKAWDRLVALNPEGSSRGYMQLGLVHASLDARAPVDLSLAENYFRRALAVDPDSGALLEIGEVAVLRGDWAAAESALRRAGEDNPMSMAAPYLIGYLMFRRGDAAAAFEHFKVAVARGEVKKAAVNWTEEGDVKADPALRWQALARQSVFGTHWLRLRDYRAPPGPSMGAMRHEYRRLADTLVEFRRARGVR